MRVDARLVKTKDDYLLQLWHEARLHFRHVDDLIMQNTLPTLNTFRPTAESELARQLNAFPSLKFVAPGW